MENKPSGGRFIAALLFFATTAGIAILLLLTALVIWLSSVTGSFIASALIAGGFFAVLALLVYLFAIISYEIVNQFFKTDFFGRIARF